MVALSLFLLVGWRPFTEPPDYPELPSNYGEWQEYNYFIDSDSSPFYMYKRWHELQSVTDSSQLPYLIDLKGLIIIEGEGDSLFGEVEYYPDSTGWEKNKDRRHVYIRWYPHQEVNLDSQSILSNLMPFSRWDAEYNAIAMNLKGFQNVTMSVGKGLRLRGWWWDTQCDYATHWIGSFATYFIPTETFDFRITCLSTIYAYSSEEPAFGPETYPDRIRELERAVEKTFRVKE